MRISRLIELTLFYKLQDLFSTSKNAERISSADFKTYNLKYTNIQPQYPVNVYVDGVLSSAYTIDYVNGIITFASALVSTNIVTVDYTYCPVNIYDEGRNPLSQDFKYPAVAVYEDTASLHPYELGTGNREIRSYWIFEVYAERGGENNDIKDAIVDMMQEDPFPIIDYNLGFPINRDGTKNTSFDSNNASAYANIYSINYIKGGSLDIGDKPKYMSQIHVELSIIP